MIRTLAAMARELGLRPPAEDRPLSGVTDDSRHVTPGTAFVAHAGTSADGHDFVADAVARGAVAVVAERAVDVDVPLWIVDDGRAALARWAAAFYGRPTDRLYTVGVTGTNGKTSVCHFVAHLLGAEETAVVGTVANFERGMWGLTTPPSQVVQRLAREAVDAGKRSLVLEASSIGLAQRRLEEVAFDAAVFTNLTRDHLDLHGTMAAYGEAKALLFRALRPSGCGIVNVDDPFSDALRRVAPGRVLTYALDRPADLTASVEREDERGLHIAVQAPNGRASVVVSVHGRHGAYNALAALGVAVAAERPFEETVERLATLPPVPGRWEAFLRDDGVTAVVDYAHTPDGLDRVLSALRALYADVVVVFGCAGGSDRGKRPEMGRVAGRTASFVVVTSDNPKGEDPRSIAEEVAEGVIEAGTECTIVLDRCDAIARAVERARRGTVILLAGKGHETYQIVHGAFEPHSDGAALEALGFRRRETRPV